MIHRRSLLLSCSLASLSCHAFVVREPAARFPIQASTLEDYQQTSVFAPRQVFSSLMETTLPPQQQQQPPSQFVVTTDGTQSITRDSDMSQFWGPVLASAFSLTSNTVGAGCLVLPQLAAGPGLLTTTAIATVCYIVNLLSGLLLAHVAIRQYETQNEKPSSFQELACTNLESPVVAQLLSVVSMATNGCLQAFGATQAGLLLAGALAGFAGMEHGSPLLSGLATVLWAGGMTTVVGTQSPKQLAKYGSICAAGLLATFAGLVGPGMMQLPESLPQTILNTPGTMELSSPEWMAAVAQLSPVLLMSLIYQNMVPTLCQTLDYDRNKVVTAIGLGSAVPLFMYLAWCGVCVGGGLDALSISGSAAAATGPLVAIFSLITLMGSGLGSGMSLAQEVQNYVNDKEQENSSSTPFGIPATALAIGVPVTAALAFGGEGGQGVLAALSVAGAFGSPLLYGAIPLAMAWKQNQKLESKDNIASKRSFSNTENRDNGSIFPPAIVPKAALPCVGLLSLGVVGQEILQKMAPQVGL